MGAVKRTHHNSVRRQKTYKLIRRHPEVYAGMVFNEISSNTASFVTAISNLFKPVVEAMLITLRRMQSDINKEQNNDR